MGMLYNVLFIDDHLGNGYFLMIKVLFIPTNVFVPDISSVLFYIFFGKLPHVKNVRKTKNERLKNNMNHCNQRYHAQKFGVIGVQTRYFPIHFQYF